MCRYEDDFEQEAEDEALLEPTSNGAQPKRPKAPDPDDDLIVEQLSKSPSRDIGKVANQSKDKSGKDNSLKLNLNKETAKASGR
jgi:hypothetical protein